LGRNQGRRERQDGKQSPFHLLSPGSSSPNQLGEERGTASVWIILVNDPNSLNVSGTIPTCR
jgi:hypothetical protein